MSETSREFETVIRIMCERNHGAALNAVIEDYPEIWELIESHTNQAVREADQKWIDAFGAQDLEPRVTPESLAKWVFRDVEQQLNRLKAELAGAERRGREEMRKLAANIASNKCATGIEAGNMIRALPLDPQGKSDTLEGMMLRIICRMEDAGKAANVGGSVDCEYKTFDVELPEVEEYLQPKKDFTYRSVEVIGIELRKPDTPEGTK